VMLILYIISNVDNTRDIIPSLTNNYR